MIYFVCSFEPGSEVDSIAQAGVVNAEVTAKVSHQHRIRVNSNSMPTERKDRKQTQNIDHGVDTFGEKVYVILGRPSASQLW